MKEPHPSPLLKERGQSKKGINGASPVIWMSLETYAKGLRKSQTKAKKLLWDELRNSKLGTKFRRQHVIDKYILDFFCVEYQLAVEVDGEIHLQQKEYDRSRDEHLSELGIVTLRFSNEKIMLNMIETINEIRATLSQSIKSWRGVGDEVL